MPICKYFQEGRCRFGDSCWNEHPRGAGRGQHTAAYRGNWGNPFQKHQSNYIQPSTFYKPAPWGGGGRDVDRRGFGGAETGKKTAPSSGGFLQNRFTALSGDDQNRDAENLLEIVRKDIEAWEISGQWLFSCYSVAKEYACVSGLVDISPEELRLEYYNSKAGGSLSNYADSIRQLSNQQKNRMLEIKKPNSSVRSSMSAELRKPNQQKPATGFGGMQTSTFGSSGFASSSVNSSSFSFKPSAGFGNTTTTSQFGNSSAPLSGFETKRASSSVFGNTSTFALPTSTPASAPGAFGGSATSSAASAAVFGSSTPFGSNSTMGSSGFGGSASAQAPTSSAFGSTVTTTTTNVFGGNVIAPANSFGSKGTTTTTATTNVFGSTAASVSQSQSIPVGNNSVNGNDKLYTPRTELSADDLQEFEAKKFTLGRIPLRPPPIELLNV
ncbi:nucleoporin NUP42 [Chiloscyllium plagiosum]|uniref:nucleoporin NUP42 n=1 Tax=Chiloscyllium plagiosum TaxID=36176 RepID=UPI001CB839B8|nr:nucleoporin NUP42 [Chiloscyllium plagiosum]